MRNNTFCRTELKYFFNAESNYQRNDAYAEIYLIICEIFRLKMGDFELFAF